MTKDEASTLVDGDIVRHDGQNHVVIHSSIRAVMACKSVPFINPTEWGMTREQFLAPMAVGTALNHYLLGPCVLVAESLAVRVSCVSDAPGEWSRLPVNAAGT